MQDQGKRLLVAVVLALGVLLLWQKFLGPKEEPPKPGQGSGSNIPAETTSTSTLKATSQVGYSGEAPATKPEVIELAFPRFHVAFSNIDAALTSWQLTDERYRKDPTSREGELVSGKGELIVGFTKDSTFKLPKNAVWTGTKLSDHQVQYKLSTDDLELTKTYDVAPEAFTVRMNLSVVAKKDAVQRLAVTSYAVQDPKQSGGGSSRVQPRVWGSSTLRGGSLVETPVKDIIKNARFEQNIQWTGFEHPFLLVAFAPRPATAVGAGVEKHTYADDDGVMQTDMLWPPAQKTMTQEVVSYLGPKNYDALGHADTVAGFSTGFNQVIDLGWFAFLGKPLLWLLLKFHSVVGNWGVAIVLLTILVKIITLYWMTKSMRSMKAMAALGPQIKELNEKYKGDKQRLQIETMALYKQNGANPLSGCLPMFLQMPIWIALYRMLSSAGELYRQPFITGWINDLTLADPIYVLPVLLVVTNFIQARLTPQNPDPSQRTQQKIMQYGMPLMFGALAFVFPAGLALYMFTNTVLSALHSIYMNKFDKKSVELAAKIKANQEKAAAAKSTAAVTGAKDANPKKADAPRAVTSGDDDDDEEEAQPKAAPRVPVRQRPKKKKRR